MIKTSLEILTEFGLDARGILFVLHPGLVMSTSDGDHHYISGAELKQLWGINTPCTIQQGHRWSFEEEPRHRTSAFKCVDLYPDPSGEYNLEKIVLEKLLQNF